MPYIWKTEERKMVCLRAPDGYLVAEIDTVPDKQGYHIWRVFGRDACLLDGGGTDTIERAQEKVAKVTSDNGRVMPIVHEPWVPLVVAPTPPTSERAQVRVEGYPWRLLAIGIRHDDHRPGSVQLQFDSLVGPTAAVLELVRRLGYVEMHPATPYILLVTDCVTGATVKYTNVVLDSYSLSVTSYTFDSDSMTTCDLMTMRAASREELPKP